VEELTAMGVLKGLPARVLALALVLQAAAFYAVASRKEIIPTPPPLSTFPTSFGEWTMEREFPLEKEVADVLRADDTVNRVYASAAAGGRRASLFVAFFKTQRYGQSPHSPKNCMPGSGWQPLEESYMPLAAPGRDEPVVVNKYMIARGDERSMVLYWYQTHKRVIAGEFEAKFWLVADAIRYGRSDTALVRVIVPVLDTPEASLKAATDFAAEAYPRITAQLP
jgi:EpsI family protein